MSIIKEPELVKLYRTTDNKTHETLAAAQRHEALVALSKKFLTIDFVDRDATFEEIIDFLRTEHVNIVVLLNMAYGSIDKALVAIDILESDG